MNVIDQPVLVLLTRNNRRGISPSIRPLKVILYSDHITTVYRRLYNIGAFPGSSLRLSFLAYFYLPLPFPRLLSFSVSSLSLLLLSSPSLFPLLLFLLTSLPLAEPFLPSHSFPPVLPLSLFSPLPFADSSTFYSSLSFSPFVFFQIFYYLC